MFRKNISSFIVIKEAVKLNNIYLLILQPASQLENKIRFEENEAKKETIKKEYRNKVCIWEIGNKEIETRKHLFLERIVYKIQI